jgi:hypothetical protein
MKNKSIWFWVLFGFLLLGSLIFHGWTIRRPLVGHHDFLNGQVVTTVDIWNKEGILKYSFVPVYSYNSVIPVREGFGVVGKNGRTYYVSYPPFAFIIVYLISYLPFIGVNQAISKIASLMGFTSLFLMIFKYVYNKYGTYTAFFTSIVFSIFPISAYFLGNVYFVDIAMLPFWFLSFLLFTKLVKSPDNIKLYLGFFLTLFIICFTEWMGLLLTFSLFVMILLFRKKFHWNIKYTIQFLSNLFIVSILSMGVTIGIFLSQIDSKALWNNMYNKYLFRSNAPAFISGDMTAIKSYFSEYLTKFTFHLTLGFGQYYLYIFIFILFGAILSFIFKVNSQKKTELVTILFFFVITPILHYIIFNQFHYWHDFGNLYMYFIIIFLFMWTFATMEKAIDNNFKKLQNAVKIILGLAIVITIPLTSKTGYLDYFRDWLWVPVYFPNIYTNMRNSTNPDDLILTNHDYNPMNWYYYQRAVIGPIIGQPVLDFKNTYPKASNIFYMSDNKTNVDQSCGDKKVEFANNIFYCKLY